MSDLRGFVDDRRAILRVSGAEAREWLQGLVTNDVARLEPDAPVYAAMLTPQGKYLFDFFLLADGADVLIDVLAARAADLAKRLAMYRIRRQVAVAPEPGLGVALVWGPGAPGLPDPREPGLGARLYAADPAAALSEAGAAPATRAEHDAMRVALAAPETGVDLIAEETFILEAGFDRLNGVDFRKGCYVGQEVTARMRHKTELRKGLRRVRLEGAAEPGAALTAADGKPAGALGSVAGAQALAHVRFDRAAAPMTAGAATVTLAD